MGGKKNRNNNSNKANDQSVDPVDHQETPDTPEEVVAPAPVENVPAENKKQFEELPMASDAINKGAAQKTVDAAVTVAKDVVKATVEQIKTQIGEENTQKAIDFANKAKSEVTEVVDYAKEAVGDAKNKAKEMANAKVTEVKEKASAKAVEVKDKATARVNETVDNLKHNDKVRGAAKKADDATRWLKGEIAETSLENKAVNVTSIVIATALAASSAALGVVGLNKTATSAVTTVRNGVTGIATKAPLVQSVHSFANQYWPYQLAARMVVHVDASVKKRLSKGNGEITPNSIPTPTKPAAPSATSEKTSTVTA